MIQIKEEKSKKKYIDNLNEKIAVLISSKDLRIRKGVNQDVMKDILKETASQGFIRTHALISNWLKEFIEKGVLEQKTMHEIIRDIPWSWDMAIQYFNALLKNDIIEYSRDSKGKKICFFKTTSLFNNSKSDSTQLSRLFRFFKDNNKDSVIGFNSEIYQNCSTFYCIRRQLQDIISKVGDVKSKIEQANVREVSYFIDELTRAYLKLDYHEEVEPQSRILSVLLKKTLMLYSLKRG